MSCAPRCPNSVSVGNHQSHSMLALMAGSRVLGAASLATAAFLGGSSRSRIAIGGWGCWVLAWQALGARRAVGASHLANAALLLEVFAQPVTSDLVGFPMPECAVT